MAEPAGAVTKTFVALFGLQTQGDAMNQFCLQGTMLSLRTKPQATH